MVLLRQFVFERQNQGLGREQKRLIELLLPDRISLEGICRVVGIPAYHLYNYMGEPLDEEEYTGGIFGLWDDNEDDLLISYEYVERFDIYYGI